MYVYVLLSKMIQMTQRLGAKIIITQKIITPHIKFTSAICEMILSLIKIFF